MVDFLCKVQRAGKREGCGLRICFWSKYNFPADEWVLLFVRYFLYWMVDFLCKVQRAGEREGCGHLRRARQQGISLLLYLIVIFCVRYNGLVNAKAVGISAGPDNKGFVLTTKRSKVNKYLNLWESSLMVYGQTN